MENIIISFSGGRTSAYLAYYMKQKHSDKNLIFVFANTGKEKKETLEFVHRCDVSFNLGVHWVEAVTNPEKGIGVTFKKVDFHTAARNGEPFEQLISKFGIPNIKRPFCSKELKAIPIDKFIKSLGIKEYKTAIGIRADEQHRVNWAAAKKRNLIYPFVTEHRIDKNYVRKFWNSQCFDLNLKEHEGNCDFCYKKSFRKLLTLAADNPEALKWWIDMEAKYEGGEHSFFRNHTKGVDILEMCKKPFQRFEDLSDVENTLFDYDLDAESNCFCKVD